MKGILFTAAMMLVLAGQAHSADQIMFLSHGMELSQSTKTISGSEFARYEPLVQNLIAGLGKKQEFSDIGPDAAYITADIEYRKKRYKVNSWYPINRSNPKIAFSEKYGMVFVSSAEEKTRIEAANSGRYKAVLKFWDAIAEMGDASRGNQSGPANPVREGPR